MKRIITGGILFLIGVYALLSGGLPLLVFLLVIGWLAFYEVQQMTELKSYFLLGVNLILYTGLLFFVYLVGVGEGLLVFTGASVGLYAVEMHEFYHKRLIFRSILVLNNIKFFLYISLGFSSILLLRDTPNGVAFIVLAFLSIWASDVFAYYGGKWFGAHPLSSISPNKTKEGTASGILSAVIIVGVVAYVSGYSLVFSGGAGVIAVLAQVGDLYESLIKRTYNVKDSSNFLPGHGGILDRADSSLFVAPLMYLMVVFLTL